MALYFHGGKGNFDADKFNFWLVCFGLGRVSEGFLGGWGWLVGWGFVCFLVSFRFFPPAITFRMKISKLLGAVLEAGNHCSLIYF